MKARDLKPSYDFRQSVQKPGPAIPRRRVIVATSDCKPRKVAHFTTETARKENATEDVRVSFRDIDDEIRHWRKTRDGFEEWIEERKGLREGLESIQFDGTWILNKPEKTESEIRVVERLHPVRDNDKRKVLHSTKGFDENMSARVGLLPRIVCPLPMALPLIADYLRENRLRLIDLFVNVDKDKDWTMTRDEIKKTFKLIDIPLTDVQLDELVTTLDISNDNQLNYKELSIGIDAYYKERRWQKINSNYNGFTGVHEKSFASRRKPNLNLKPQEHNFEENTYDICLKKMEDDKNKLKQQQPVNLGKSTKLDLKNQNFETTLSGSTTESKVKYLRHADEECKRCIDVLRANGIYAPNNTIRRVLVPPSENESDMCTLHLSSTLSAFPYNHPSNIAYRKTQRRKLQELLSLSNSPTKNGDMTYDVTAGKHKNFLPRVVSEEMMANIVNEGRCRRRRIETASPTPCWPQHLLDKLCLCMDDCHVRKDGKSAVFNIVT